MNAELTHEEAMVRRCQVLAARHWYAFLGCPCTSPFECERCYMPAKETGRPCELCGWTSFIPLQGHGIAAVRQ